MHTIREGSQLCKTQGCFHSLGGDIDYIKINTLEKKQDIAAAINASKKTSRIRSYMHNHLVFSGSSVVLSMYETKICLIQVAPHQSLMKNMSEIE